MTFQIERVILQHHKLPLRQPLKTAFGSICDRTCIVIQICDTEGRMGWGEASPLPGFGMESLVETQAVLDNLQTGLVGMEFASLHEIAVFLTEFSQSPAAKHGVELALCNLLAIAQAKSLSQLINPQSRNRLPVNALIGAVSPAIAVNLAQSFETKGYSCIKVKIGTDLADRDWQRVAAIRDAISPHVQIRLDANQAWSVDEAIAQIRRYEPLGIEYVEQPVAAQDLEGMAKVKRSVGIAIAADEAITCIDDLREVIACKAADIAILKPMAMGGILTARQAADVAFAAGLDVVITTTIDGAIARLGALHLAASIPQITRACGLATGELLANDLVPACPMPERGAIAVPA
ncbi:o-succinylbenzoate synthase [Pseudanabaena sp. PCC 6802]|uniref:o-succinylbenzoate synthase n=1 Tax=Pseudanabaena sp. PCC 6802 TaxID=118173 RepID=UPI0003765311|nr:o-succinylbenzoate synthase [Pseudanabaena sp. PCC 6802]